LADIYSLYDLKQILLSTLFNLLLFVEYIFLSDICVHVVPGVCV